MVRAAVRGSTTLWLALALVVSAGMPAALAQTAAGGIYSCEDAQGRKLTADRPITSCMDREQRVLDRSGSEKGRIGPFLSEQEAYQLEQRQRTLALQRRQAQEAARKEQALVQRYPRQELHEAEQKLALTQVNARIATAIQRMEVLRIERGIQAQEMEFYIRDVTLAPGTLQRLVADTDGMLYQQLKYLQTLQRERIDILARYASERQMLQRYWDQMEAAANGTPAPAKP